MATHQRESGITINVPDDTAVDDATAVLPGVRRGGRKPLPKGPVAMPAAAPADDPIVAAMIAQDLALVDAVDLTPAPGAVRRGTRTPSRLTIDVEANEDSVVLFEQDGVYSWRYPDEIEAVTPTERRGPVRERARRRVTFDLSVDPSPDAAARRTRGPVADFVIGKVRAYVFKFVARVAVDSAIGFLERKKRTGLVRLDVDDPTRWAPFERLDEIELPAERPARILLLVHGTFSSTVGSYGALGVSGPGKAFLARARAHYDAIVGYDHRTLSRDPLQNAEDLLGRLEAAKSPALEIDAVAYSRGGLVLRSLVEYLLPHASVRARVRRAVFVGATNDGTQLASQDNWKRLIDLTTNLVAVGCKTLSVFAPAALAATIVRESIDTLGALVKALATEILSEDAVPGLAAMVPGGRFVTEINKAQRGQPNAADSLYYVVSSEFDVRGILSGGGAPEFPQRLARWAADAVVDAEMREANDLVVNTASMSAIDGATGGFVKDRWTFEKNPHVYHTVYFTREEVVRAMTRWLGLDAVVASSAGSTLPLAPPSVPAPPTAPAPQPPPAAPPVRRMRGAPARRGTGQRAKPPLPTSPQQTAPPPARGTVFVAGDMPQELRLGDTVSVNVVVSHDQLVVTAGPTAATTTVKVALDRPIVVQLVAKRNLTTVGDDFAEIDPAVPRTELVFRVKGASEGAGEVWVQIAQGPVVLAKLVLSPTIVAKEATAAATRATDAADASLADPDTEPYPILQIFEAQIGDKLRYHFVVQLGDGQYLSKYSAPLQGSREEYVARIYKEIEDRWLSNDDDFAAFEQELRAYGATLLDELVPAEVQAALWAQRATLDAIQVVAEEPFIPWEIVHLKEPGKVVTKERNFLGDKGLVRWLHNEGPAPHALRVRRDHSFYVIPKYPHPDWELPEAQKEIPFLVKTLGSRPVEPKNIAITELLGTRGAVDHFHFSGHGEAETNDAVFAQLMLGGTLENNEWAPRYLKADVIAQTAQLAADDGAQPVVMLNACQIGRLGWRLTSIGGFAQSFIDRGAGVFVGSLWSVGDVPARHFSEAFYGALVAGKTLSAAATAGRNAARDEGDGTYLAFVVYGSPHAKVTVAKN